MSWSRLPEWARWILFVPALLLGWFAFALLMRLLNLLRGDLGFLGEVGAAGFTAWALYHIAFALAPRGKVVVGWLIFVPMTLFVGLMLILMIVRGLAVAGLLPPVPVAGDSWEPGDWTELGRSVAWLLGGTASFFGRLNEQRRLAPERLSDGSHHH